MAITTNRDYIAKALAKFNITDDDVDLLLAECPEVVENAPLNVTACKQAIHKSLSVFLPLANTSESQFSITWNMEAIKLWYNSLCKELGRPNALKPALRNRSNLW